VYYTTTLVQARANLAAGRRKAAGLLTGPGVRVRWVEEEALRAIDPDLRSLADVDTPEDLVRSQTD
jgi:hypothetical protein